MTANTDLPIHQELRPGEQLLWSGRPMQGLHTRRADLFSIPLAAIAGSIALLWFVGRVGSDGGTLLCFGAPIVLMGCYIAFGRIVMVAITHRQTYYGLTDQRILIISGLLVREITRLDLNTITEVTLQQRFGDAGTVLFSVEGQSGMLPRDSSWLSTNHHRPPRFEQLADAEHVVWLIRQTPAVDAAAGLAVQRLKVAGRIGAILDCHVILPFSIFSICPFRIMCILS